MTESRVWAVARRDLVAACSGPTVWLILAGWLLITGLALGVTVTAVQGQTSAVPLVTASLATAAVLLLILAPAVTMGAIAGERQAGTMPLLLTAPMSDLQIVAGKAVAVGGLLLILVASLGLQVGALALIAAVDVPQALAGLLGLALLAAACGGVGLWISALVDAPVTAYVLACAILLVLGLIGLLPSDGVAGAIARWGIGPRLGPFLDGRIGLVNVGYFLGIAGMGVVLAAAALAARRIDG
jgi:ABC-2 type transport system permease protein